MDKKINIRVMPGAKKDIVKEEDGVLKVYTTAPAVDGKANKAVLPILAKYLSTRKSCIEIIKGLKSRNKVVIIKD